MKLLKQNKILSVSLAIVMFFSSSPVLAYSEASLETEIISDSQIINAISLVSNAINNPFLEEGMELIDKAETSVVSLPDGETKKALENTLNIARKMNITLDKIHFIWEVLGKEGWQSNFPKAKDEVEQLRQDLVKYLGNEHIVSKNFAGAVEETQNVFVAFELMDKAAIDPTDNNIKAAEDAVEKMINEVAKKNAKERIDKEIKKTEIKPVPQPQPNPVLPTSTDIINSVGTHNGNLSLSALGVSNRVYGPATQKRTIDGNLNISGNISGIITLRNIIVEGDLVIDTENATVTLEQSVTVNGTTTIKDVSNNTFNNHGTLSEVIISDENGGTFNNQGTVQGEIKIEPQNPSSAPVNLRGTIDRPVLVQGNGPQITITEDADVTGNITVSSSNAVISVKSDNANIIVEENISGVRLEVAQGKEVTITAPKDSISAIKGSGTVTPSGDSGIKAEDIEGLKEEKKLEKLYSDLEEMNSDLFKLTTGMFVDVDSANVPKGAYWINNERYNAISELQSEVSNVLHGGKEITVTELEEMIQELTEEINEFKNARQIGTKEGDLDEAEYRIGKGSTFIGVGTKSRGVGSIKYDNQELQRGIGKDYEPEWKDGISGFLISPNFLSSKLTNPGETLTLKVVIIQYDKDLNEKELTLEVLITAVEDNTEFQKATVSESNISISSSDDFKSANTLWTLGNSTLSRIYDGERDLESGPIGDYVVLGEASLGTNISINHTYVSSKLIELGDKVELDFIFDEGTINEHIIKVTITLVDSSNEEFQKATLAYGISNEISIPVTLEHKEVSLGFDLNDSSMSRIYDGEKNLTEGMLGEFRYVANLLSSIVINKQYIEEKLINIGDKLELDFIFDEGTINEHIIKVTITLVDSAYETSPVLESVELINNPDWQINSITTYDRFKITFSKPMITAENSTFQVNGNVVILQDGTTLSFSEGGVGTLANGNITWNPDATEATFNFEGMAGGSTPFYGTVTPGPVVITDVNGNLLSTDSVIATGGF